MVSNNSEEASFSTIERSYKASGLTADWNFYLDFWVWTFTFSRSVKFHFVQKYSHLMFKISLFLAFLNGLDVWGTYLETTFVNGSKQHFFLTPLKKAATKKAYTLLTYFMSCF